MRHLALSVLCLILAGCGADATSGAGAPDRGPGDTGSDRGTGRTDDGGRGGVLDAGVDAPSAPEDTGRAEGDASSEIGPDADGVGTDDTGSETDAAADTLDPGSAGGVVGRVWAPGNAPGMVPGGQEIPISGALVYLTDDRPTPIPQRAYCAACETPPARSALSRADGTFSIEGYAPGTWWLVIEKGQFRLEQQIEILEGTLTPLDADATTLPSVNDPDAGTTTPRIALAAGSFDHLEDILGKMGMGDVDAGGIYVPESAGGVIDVWDNGGSDFGAATVGSLSDLVRDLDRMLDYHIIFVPCSGSGHTGALNDQGVLRNIRDYVAAGGNLYVTDWSGEWADNVFPAQLELGGGVFGFGNTTDTPANAYDAASDTWNTARFGDADGSSYDTPNAQALDRELHDWLEGQVGPTAHSDAASTYDADYFEVEGNWNTIESVNSIEVGTNDRGEPILDEPRVWVHGGSDSRPTPRKPLTVSFEPTGCGRVLYSTYHTTDDRHVGLAPQERVLLYLIMEIGTCRDPKR